MDSMDAIIAKLEVIASWYPENTENRHELDELVYRIKVMQDVAMSRESDRLTQARYNAHWRERLRGVIEYQFEREA